MAPRPLRLEVDGGEVVFTSPAEARAASRRWKRMARDLAAGNPPPAAQAKVRELRARAKAADDWARHTEDAAPVTEPAAAGPPADEPARTPSPARRRAAQALAESGFTRTRRGTTRARRAARTASRRYERAGGAPVAAGLGELAIYLAGGVITLVLLEDLLSRQGSGAFAGATKTVSAITHRVIAPVPLVQKGGA
jgi:hypothetical protein